MSVIKVNDLPEKDTLESSDRIVGYSTNGGTSLLIAQNFINLKNAAESAKNDAVNAASSATSAVSGFDTRVATAKSEIDTKKTQAVDAVAAQQTTSVGAVTSAQTTAVSAVNTAKSTAVNAVSAQQTTSVGAVQSAQTTAVNAVSTKQTSAVNAVNSAQTAATDAISGLVTQATNAKNAAENARDAAGGFASDAETTAGQVATAVTQGKAAIVAQETASKQAVVTTQNEAISAVNSAKTSAVNAVNTQGNTSVGQVQGAQATATTALNEIVAQAENLLNTSHNLLDVKWSDHLLNDVRWLRADTWSWHDGNVYSAVYNYLEAQRTSEGSTVKTAEGVTYWETPDGLRIASSSQATNVQNLFESTGIAWFYIIDATNHRFKLPRTKFGFEGLRNAVGGTVEPGLPNITGYCGIGGVSGVSYDVSINPNDSGALTNHSTGLVANIGGNYLTEKPSGLVLDASRSNSIYGNSDTVQPPATQMYLYFYVGHYTQAALAQTAGLNAELFNGKVDVIADQPVDRIVAQGDGYIRYANGLQICSGEILLPNISGGTNTNASGNFPLSFNEAPKIVVSYKGSGSGWADFMLVGYANSGTTFGVNVWNVPGSGGYFVNNSVYWIAIGRWK